MLATTVYWRSNTDNKERKVIGWHDGTNWLILSPKDYTVLIKRVQNFVLLNYSCKSWSNFKTRDRFGICRSWGFQNTPYMCNLTKFWLRYLRLKTHDTILLFSCYLICWRWKWQKSEQFVPKIVLFTIKGTNINKNNP